MVIPRQTFDALPMTSAYFRLILGEFGGGARDRAALLAGTGVTEPGSEITLGQQLRQIRNANRLLPPEWALSIGARLHAATHGPVGVAVATAPTLRDALAVMTRYGWVRSPHFRLRATVDGDDLRLVPEDQVMLGEAERRALRDLVLLSTQGLLEAATGRPIHEARVELPASGRHAEWFHAPVRPGRREAALVIPTRWLDTPCPLADPIAYAESMRRLVGDASRLAGDDTWLARVEGHVDAHRGRPDLDEVARALHVSRRTLIRRLAEAGTTWRALLEASQKQRAATLLREPGIDVAQVAWMLGYQDPSNFGRAFRRWFGVSPGLYRARSRRGH